MFSVCRRRGALATAVFGTILATSLWFNISYRDTIEKDREELARGVARSRSLERAKAQLEHETARLRSALAQKPPPSQPPPPAWSPPASRQPPPAAEEVKGGQRAPWLGADPVLAGEEVAAPGSVDACHSVAEKRAFIKRMMKTSWDGYRKHAWGYNELDPAHNTFHENTLFGSNSGATIIDALDTLHLMGLSKELADARQWVASELNMDVDKKGSVFELTIRYLGGFLSAYAVTGDTLFRDKAEDIGSRLVKAFNTPSGIPNALVNLRDGTGEKFGWVRCNCAILSEMGTLQIEFDFLSVVTGDPRYARAANKAMDLVLKQSRPQGMFPNFVDMSSGQLTSNDFRLGAMGDSFYEYLVKYWRYQGGRDRWDAGRALVDDVFRAVRGALVKKDSKGQMYIGDIAGGTFQTRMDHLACFLGGTLMMASEGTKDKQDAGMYREMAEGVTSTCHHSYQRTKTGLGPDIMDFTGDNDGTPRPGNEFYWLRPETVESYFYMWRYTKDVKYRQWAWDAVRAIEAHCRCGSGYCGLNNVEVDGTASNWHSTQESFFLAETLKYLYLTFSEDELLPLEDWVFNTEAHPIPVQTDRHRG